MVDSVSERLEYTKVLKFVIIGHVNVGKTSIIRKFTEGLFKGNALHTVGVDYQSKIINYGGENIKLQIWDTAGHERFRTLTQGFYRGAAGILVVYDITNSVSFDQIPMWVESITENCYNPPLVCIVGNKVDLIAERAIDRAKGEHIAKQYEYEYNECSAKDGTNITEIFRKLTEMIIAKNNANIANTDPNNLKLVANSKGTGHKRFCC